MRLSDITPAVFGKNEEYWIHYCIRDLLRVFGHVVYLDTGSTDATIQIVRDTAQLVGGVLHLMQEDYGDDAHRIGNSANVLRSYVSTDWMLLVNGDEIYREAQLRLLADENIDGDKLIGMLLGRNLCFDDNHNAIMERDGFSADRLVRREVVWDKTDYPFESHGLDEKVAKGQVHYVDGGKVWFWHMRHVHRSSCDGSTYFRREKQSYFPWDGQVQPLPFDWLGEVADFANPYLATYTT